MGDGADGDGIKREGRSGGFNRSRFERVRYERVPLERRLERLRNNGTGRLEELGSTASVMDRKVRNGLTKSSNPSSSSSRFRKLFSPSDPSLPSFSTFDPSLDSSSCCHSDRLRTRFRPNVARAEVRRDAGGDAAHVGNDSVRMGESLAVEGGTDSAWWRVMSSDVGSGWNRVSTS